MWRIRKMIRKPKDRDFIETVDGLFFCVVGYIHQSDKYTAYLKYIPSDKGKWQHNDKHYWRVLDYYHVLNIEKTFEFLTASAGSPLPKGRG